MTGQTWVFVICRTLEVLGGTVDQARGRNGRIPDALLREEKNEIALQILGRSRELHIRALAGGGSVLTARGLISPLVTRSLSLVVDPSSTRHFIDEITRMGWRSLSRRRAGILPPVRHTFSHPQWNALVNVFSVIPGFFADPEATFDFLWERRREVPVLGDTISGLDRLSSAVLASHNGLDGRGAHASSHSEFFADQFRKVLSDSERAELGPIVRKVGGGAEMNSFLAAMNVEPVEFTLPSIAYLRWRIGVDDASDQLRRFIWFMESPPEARSYIFRGRSVRRGTATSLVSKLREFPRTVRLILTARRRMSETEG